MAGRHGHARAPVASRAAPRVSLSGTSAPFEVQVFGRRDSRATQRALRFFRERRTRVVFVDLAARPIAAGELRRFSERFSSDALIDRESRAYRAAGLGYMRFGNDEALERLLSNQLLLRLPLVRSGNLLSVGLDEAAWRSWPTTQ